jgi:hypothetical protein
MTAVLQQPSPAEAVERFTLQTVSRRSDKIAAMAACALGFFGFMPYPAINVGNTSALQVGNILTVLMLVPFVATLRWRRPLNIYPLLMIPLCLSAMAVAATGGGDVSLSLKLTAVLGITGLTMCATQLYVPRYALELLTGIAAAMIVHFVVGMWQFYAFRSDSFPLAELYVNQSFLSVQDNVTTIARWIKRPFGVFPEPSAMSSSLAPWVLLFAAHFLGLVHLKRQPTRRQAQLFAAAAAGGLLLIILSRSGHAAFTLAALGVMGLVWGLRVKAKPQTHLLAIAATAIVLPFVILLAATMLGDRVGGASKLGNSSWEERSSSLVVGFRLLTEGSVGTTLFGVGPGLSSPALKSLYDLEAVWSVLLSYVYETGLLGIVVVAWVGRTLLRTWKSMGHSLAFASFAGVWVVGITLTTSYSQLLPIWIAFGWLTMWPLVCGTTEAVVTTDTTRTTGERLRASREHAAHYQPHFRPTAPAWGKMQDSL